MNEAPSDAMKTIALATSAERPRRSIGTVVTSDKFLAPHSYLAVESLAPRRKKLPMS